MQYDFQERNHIEDYMASLLVISYAPARHVDEKLLLDIKFVEGMRQYKKFWNGPVSCLLRESDHAFPFSQAYSPDQLPFGIVLFSGDTKVNVQDLAEYDIILCGGDNHEYLHLAEDCRAAGKKLVFNIENIPETRRQIASLDRTKSLPKKIHSYLWMLNDERRRLRAFRHADGVQANGYPAFSVYRTANPNTMMYLDNRLGEKMLSTEQEMEACRQHVTSGAPVRLVHSGRLEPLKGSHDLVPIARRLEAKGVPFELNIFGTGSLEDEIRRSISRHGLEEKIKLNGSVDFETELVPFSRTQADIYLSCHRQSDPSCTYIESMGCGLAVVGYDNRMWAALCRDSDAGWMSPLGDPGALADAIAAAADNRQALAARCRAARSFAGKHSFECEFRRRIEHLRSVL